jgi:hypothetical protein
MTDTQKHWEALLLDALAMHEELAMHESLAMHEELAMHEIAMLSNARA